MQNWDALVTVQAVPQRIIPYARMYICMFIQVSLVSARERERDRETNRGRREREREIEERDSCHDPL